MKQIRRIFLCLLAAAFLCVSCSSGQVKESSSGTPSSAASLANSGGNGSAPASPESTQALSFLQSGDLDAVALKSAGFSVTKGEMVYLFAVFSANLAYYGVDTVTSLKEQPYPGVENQSWFDVLADETQTYCRELLLLCETAKARGYTLDQEDIKAVEDLKNTALANAESFGWDLDSYFQQVYGTNIGWKHMEGILSKTRLSQKIRDEIRNRTYTEEEREAEFQNNRMLYGLIDYYSIDLRDGEGISPELLADTKEALKKADSPEAFKAALSPFLSAGKDKAEIEKAGGAEAYTEQYLSKSLRRGIVYSDTDFFNWAFGEEARAGETFIQENEADQSVFAYYLLREPYKDETPLVDVRHILFKVDASHYPTAAEARAKADEVYAAWVREGASEARFSELCAQYSADGNAQSGGIYTNVYQGQMVPSFNDWCFDESRKIGDHGIVDTDFGSHMMYFVNRRISWIEEIENSLANHAMEEIIESQSALTPVEVFQETIDSINW